MNRALLVGINTYDQAPLAGCVNDVTDMAEFLVSSCGFKTEEIRLLTDKRATTAAIIERLEWLVTGALPGDRILFHYSGHGAQFPCRNLNEEIDGAYEIICPADFDWTMSKMIIDKQFVNIFSKMPQGVKFNWISDSCHSGDLDRGIPVKKSPKKVISKRYPVPADIGWRQRILKEKKIGVDRGMISGALDVGFVSGCMSNQTSADAYFGGRPNGALTYFLLKNLKKSMSQPLGSVVSNIASELKRSGYSQIPQAEGARVGSPFLG